MIRIGIRGSLLGGKVKREEIENALAASGSPSQPWQPVPAIPHGEDQPTPFHAASGAVTEDEVVDADPGWYLTSDTDCGGIHIVYVAPEDYSRSAFRDRHLTFTESSILCDGYSAREVMMAWEAPIMKRHAEVVCHNRGDVLEIGFGMGIAAERIQTQRPRSHTIVECHPQILERLHQWARGRENVTIVEGEWYEVRHELGTYDGILYDAFGDRERGAFGREVMKLTKLGAVITFWNGHTSPGTNDYGLDAEYEEIEVRPARNTYFNRTKYYLPVVRC